MKQIVGKDRREVDMIVLPQVQTLELENLPNVTSFCSRTSALNWPSLKELRIENCSKMRSFISVPSEPSLMMNSGESGGTLEDNLSIPTQSFFSEKVPTNRCM